MAVESTYAVPEQLMDYWARPEERPSVDCEVSESCRCSAPAQYLDWASRHHSHQQKQPGERTRPPSAERTLESAEEAVSQGCPLQLAESGRVSVSAAASLCC